LPVYGLAIGLFACLAFVLRKQDTSSRGLIA